MMTFLKEKRGNAILEIALVTPPFFALFFAIMDFSLVLFLQGTFQHAVREGVRFGVTQSGFGDANAPDYQRPCEAIKTVVQNSSVAFLSGPEGRNKISVTFYDPKTHQQLTGAGKNSGGNIVEVTISPCIAADGSDCFSWSWLAPFLRPVGSLTLQARSSDVMESPPNGLVPACE